MKLIKDIENAFDDVVRALGGSRVEVMREPDYIRKFEAHVRGCDECKNASPLPNVVLTRPEAPAKESR